MFIINNFQILIFVHILSILTLIVCQEDCTDNSCRLVKPTEQFQDDCLKWANEFRANHNSKPVRTSPKLLKYAISRAVSMAMINDRVAQPEGMDGEIGEIVHSFTQNGRKTGEELPCRKVVQDFYNLITKYTFDKEPKAKDVNKFRPFTQLVWKGTAELGCAQAYHKFSDDPSRFAKTVTVCAYYKPGNILNEFRENVDKPNTDLTLELKVAKAERQVWEAEGEQDIYILLEDKDRKADEKDVEEFKGIRYQKKKIRMLGMLGKVKSAPRSVNDSKVSVETYGPFECPVDQCTLVDVDDFQLECLKAVNDVRAKHLSPPLETSTKLMELARRRAIQVAKDNEDVGFPDKYSWGETAFALEQMDKASEMPCKLVVKNFYDQRKNYDYALGESIFKENSTGHLTQLLWRATKRIGCAQALHIGKSMWRKTVTVCSYDPPGNIDREYVENVYPPGGLRPEEITAKR